VCGAIAGPLKGNPDTLEALEVGTLDAGVDSGEVLGQELVAHPFVNVRRQQLIFRGALSAKDKSPGLSHVGDDDLVDAVMRLCYGVSRCSRMHLT
jgi:hypothetical protein